MKSNSRNFPKLQNVGRECFINLDLGWWSGQKFPRFWLDRDSRNSYVTLNFVCSGTELLLCCTTSCNIKLERNVRPWVERRTPSRDEFTVWTSKISPSQVYKDMVNVLLFYSYFSSRKLVRNQNFRGIGHAINRFIDTIDRRFSYSPLLNRDCGSLFKVRYARKKVLSRKNMAPSLEGDFDLRKRHSGSFAEAASTSS